MVGSCPTGERALEEDVEAPAEVDVKPSGLVLRELRSGGVPGFTCGYLPSMDCRLSLVFRPQYSGSGNVRQLFCGESCVPEMPDRPDIGPETLPYNERVCMCQHPIQYFASQATEERSKGDHITRYSDLIAVDVNCLLMQVPQSPSTTNQLACRFSVPSMVQSTPKKYTDYYWQVSYSSRTKKQKARKGVIGM